MKRNRIKLVLSLLLIAIFSCDEPNTLVTDIIHPDGSVTRKIVMRNSKNKFEKSGIQVPFDKTWNIKDSIEVNGKGDTTWIKTADKLFLNASEINSTYLNDSSVNRKMKRHAEFTKKFRWFNTNYRFAEIIGKQLQTGYPVSDFLNDEELAYFYSPDYLKFSKENGADSTKYKVLADSIEKKTERWTIKNIAAMWIAEFSELTSGKGDPAISMDSLKPLESHIVSLIEKNGDKFDSLWNNGILLRQFIGDKNALKFKTEADSALDIAVDKYLVDFRNYSVRIIMPGKLTATNGYIDSTRNLLWPVKSEFFITDQYEMWAESKTTNLWAWIVSGLFIIFVFAGTVIKRKSRPPVGGRD